MKAAIINVPCTVHKNSIVHSAVHSTRMTYIPVKQLEAPIRTCTVYANLGLRVLGPQLPGSLVPGSWSLHGSTEYSAPYLLRNIPKLTFLTKPKLLSQQIIWLLQLYDYPSHANSKNTMDQCLQVYGGGLMT